MTHAVIFDMGNTLMNFVRPGTGSWREFEEPGLRGVYSYLVEQGHPIESHEDDFVAAMFQRLAEGWEQSTGGALNMRAIDLIRASAADHALTLDETALLEAVRRYAHPLRQGVSPTPGALETLATLRARGYRLGLISNTIWPAELHLEDLETIGVLPYVEHPLFSGEVGMWKPSAAIFRHALELLDTTPEQAIFVGDSPREDIMGAQGVGMRAVWMRSREFPLGAVQPNATISALPELLPILDEWF
ncbi:haloacid dehalogenase [Kouleothrix aurantiaca]|jgi:putative hydrolase of the HAD superfamily|uniref:Haloacid dehalogenase n=1 Tax=Kouleothrix aurantiaca TaxID=186479 RepID=A0A0P9FCD5_9CHLR|nr:haloacid dehalogenase [Kouleothrix aurantiaca]